LRPEQSLFPANFNVGQLPHGGSYIVTPPRAAMDLKQAERYLSNYLAV
jgi:hypothetical protein